MKAQTKLVYWSSGDIILSKHLSNIKNGFNVQFDIADMHQDNSNHVAITTWL